MSNPFRYLSLSPMPSDMVDIPLNPLYQAALSLDAKQRAQGRASQKSSFMAWTGATWAMAAHCTLSIWITIMVLVLIEGHHFNVTERSPLVQLVGGATAAPFLPRQSDIVTLLSSIVAGVKYTLVAWIAALCWNVAFFLMEKRGLTLQQLKILLSYELLVPGVFSRDWYTWLIGALLLASLTANLSSPILTGSISWVPSNRLVHGLSTQPMQFGDVLNGTMTGLPALYSENNSIRDAFTAGAVGRVGLSWGREVDKGVLKRPGNLGGLAINSTFENVTLPYFQVHSIRWIENRDEIPALSSNVTPPDVIDRLLTTTPTTVSNQPIGYAVLVPNITTNWSSDPVESTTIHDTRLLMLFYAYALPSGIISTTRSLPSSAYTLSVNTSYYAFAWVTFSAGVGQCKQYNCVISSPYAIQNSTPIALEPNPLTFQALSMAPVIGIWMILHNTSIPFMWDNINDYVEAVLVRSYSGAWSSLNSNFRTRGTFTRYTPAVPSLLADVDGKRVGIWLGIQLLVTLLSTVFLITQSRLSQYPFVGDTSLTAFFLNTSAIKPDNINMPIDEPWEIEQREGRLRMKME
ncbi:hypothetical protein B0J17DRAFT_685165 [Rhizoctonia solani]|nr:hypothetical protein B0J17DRAFT_685165 [Rhizoctonia solani]